MQTLGLLLTREMGGGLGTAWVSCHRLRAAGLVAGPGARSAPLLSPDRLRAGLGDWLGGNAVMKRTFRNVATIAG